MLVFGEVSLSAKVFCNSRGNIDHISQGERWAFQSRHLPDIFKFSPRHVYIEKVQLCWLFLNIHACMHACIHTGRQTLHHIALHYSTLHTYIYHIELHRN